MRQYDYSKLLGRMRERGFTQETFAGAVGVSACTMNLTLNNKRDFRQDEILRACDVLGIDLGNLPANFLHTNFGFLKERKRMNTYSLSIEIQDGEVERILREMDEARRTMEVCCNKLRDLGIL